MNIKETSMQYYFYLISLSILNDKIAKKNSWLSSTLMLVHVEHQQFALSTNIYYSCWFNKTKNRAYSSEVSRLYKWLSQI